jgi:hypothetical protein
MYKYRHIQYINFPVIPEDIISELPRDLNLYETMKGENIYWSDSFNKKLNDWGQKNICPDMYFAFQMMTGDISKHKDTGTKTKLNYIFDLGGSNVCTKFWDEEDCLIDEYVLENNRWHIFKADTTHSVEGIEPNRIRWSITARIF